MGNNESHLNFFWINFENYRGNSTLYKQYVFYDGKRKLVKNEPDKYYSNRKYR